MFYFILFFNYILFYFISHYFIFVNLKIMIIIIIIIVIIIRKRKIVIININVLSNNHIYYNSHVYPIFFFFISLVQHKILLK